MAFTDIPYCGPGAVPHSFWLDWNFDGRLLFVLAVLVAVWAALARRSGQFDRGAGAAFAAGWCALAVAFISPLCALSAALFSARVIHHLLLVAVAAPLLVVAFHRIGSLRLSGRFLVPAAFAHVVLFWVWHAPAPYAAALSHDGMYWFMELSLLASALLFWAAALDRRVSVAAFAPTVIGVMAQMGFLGALLVFAGQPLYAPHAETTWAWGITPLQDQQLAGLVMWVPGALPYLALLLAGVARWLARREAVEQARRGQATGARRAR